MDLGKDTEDVVGVIVLYASKVLVVRGKSGKWSFPKGHRKENETSIEGALREAKEETGIDLSDQTPNLTLLLRYGVYYLYRLVYEPELSVTTSGEEITEVGWHTYQSIKADEKNADVRFYLKMSKPKKLKERSTYR